MRIEDVKDNTMPILLLDVSHWQGAMDWNVAKSKGVRGAIIKASEGTTWRDDQFARNVSECKRLGIAWGAYHYFYPTLNALQQASNFIDAMMGYAPDLGIWGDFEQPATGLDVQGLAQGFMNEIKKYYSAGIYTSPSYAKDVMKSAAWMKDFPLWIANYGVLKPAIPLPWTEAVIWQYSSKGTGYGSDGYIDLNNFMRADSEWEAFSGMSLDPVVIPPPVIEPPVVTPPDTTIADLKARIETLELLAGQVANMNGQIQSLELLVAGMKVNQDKQTAWMVDHVKGF